MCLVMKSVRWACPLPASGFAALLFFSSCAGAVSSATGREVEALTGAHTRVVWMRDMRRDHPQKYGNGNRFLLMGFDSRDGRGVRPILAKPGSYYRPLITPDGRQVVFTDMKRSAVFSVAWDGSDLREISRGIAGALWQDSGGKIWVYGKASSEGYKYGVVGEGDLRKKGAIIRYPMDDPERVETVWSTSEGEIANPGNLQLSAGGDAGSMTMPWPACGVAKFPDIAWIQHANGCWPGLAPDRSYLSWSFDGSHRSLMMFDPFSARSWPIDLSQAPGFEGGRAYHPRWSNHALFFAFTGPYDDEGKIVAPWPDVHIGKFLPDFSGIESWANITGSEHAEIFPDLWIEGGRSFASSKSTPAPYPAALPGEKWPSSKRGLLFLWKNNRLGNTPAQDVLGRRPAVASLSGEAYFGPEYELILRNGSARVEGYDRALINGIKASEAFSVEFVVSSQGPDRSGTHKLLALEDGARGINFAIREAAGNLVLSLRGSATESAGRMVTLCLLEPGRKKHVLVTYTGGVVTCFLDGIKISGQALEVGSLSAWNDNAKLVLGEFYPEQDSGWSGSIEGVAVYDRGLAEHEVSRNAVLFRDILRRRPKRPSWQVEAQLVSRRPAPQAEDIAPYRRALVVNRYKLIKGEITGVSDHNLMLAEWALLDGREPKSFRKKRVGETRLIKLERFDDHPQLQSERLVSEPDELDIFTEVFPW
ncbi:MAG: hypothetical protein RIQ71_918 [Verrucomicrobiota bacterium]